jgi:hypothetical protein
MRIPPTHLGSASRSDEAALLAAAKAESLTQQQLTCPLVITLCHRMPSFQACNGCADSAVLVFALPYSVTTVDSVKEDRCCSG